ncbi:LysR family transcriptional regulator [Kitasatospora sp. NPDC093806]|uniref:LysR family transcriptional regulator n=1 Tax=Kitasatospora sp. NPDC093806 TaxID=3155075 RepID=UPI00344AE27B
MSVARRIPDLFSIELLLAVGRLGSLSRAAEELGVTQPAASMRIRAMEKQVGVALVERSPNGSRLTAGGATVGDWGAQLLESAESLSTAIAALRGGREGRLRVAASPTVAEYVLPRWLGCLRRQRPGTAVVLSAEYSQAVAERVLQGEAELGFVEGAGVPAGVDALVVGRDRLVVAAAPRHPWARRGRVSGRELAGVPLVLPERGSGARQVLARALARHGGPAAPVLELPSSTAIKAAAVAGAGPAVLSSLAVEDDVRLGRLAAVEVEGVDLGRSLRAVWPQGRRPGGPARDLLAFVRRTR